MNVLITGILGSGGSYLAEYILENCPDVEVHGIARWHSNGTRRNVSSIEHKIKIHECDLLDLSSVIRVLEEVKPDRIFNLASHANVKVCFDNPIAVFNNNSTLMINLLEGVRLVCPDCIFQQCSTSEVYGNPQTTPITEGHPLQPVNPYAVSKLAQEGLAYAYFKSWNLKIIITRMFAYINPRRHDLFATAFARQVKKLQSEGGGVLYHGNLESMRTLIDVRDAMATYWVACNLCEYGVPYNIGGNDSLSVGDVLDKLIEKVDVEIKHEVNKDLLRPIDVTMQIPDCSKFNELTGWKPKYTLDESLEWLLKECHK